MNQSGRGLRARLVVLALAAVVLLPAVAFAQGGWRGQRRDDDGYYRRDDDYYRRGRRDRDNGRYGRRGRYDDRYGDRYGYYNQQLQQLALNNGYNEGIDEGRKDGSKGDRYNYTDEGDYQKATKGYNSRYGDRELYRRYFREGFARGYRDGYEQYGGYHRRDDDYYRRNRVGDILGGIFGRP